MEHIANDIITDLTESLLQAEHLDEKNYGFVLRTIQSIVDEKMETIEKKEQGCKWKSMFMEEIERHEYKIKKYDNVVSLLNNVQLVERRVDVMTENQIIILTIKVEEFTFYYEYTRRGGSCSYSHYMVELNNDKCQVSIDEIIEQDFSHNKSYKEFYTKTKANLNRKDFDYFVTAIFHTMYLNS